MHVLHQQEEAKKDDKKDKKDDKKDDKEKDFTSKQAVAVLGIALIAMGEDIGSEMAYRSFGHLVSYIRVLFNFISFK